MDAFTILKNFGNTPVTHQVLCRELKDYKSPNDKISSWMKKGYLIPIIRGVYLVSHEISGRLPDFATVANLLYRPSYVSLEYALSFYNAIPERVEEITSVTVNRSKIKNTGVGRFSYKQISKEWYKVGIENVRLPSGYFCLMASPEKALLDTVVCTKGLIFRSYKDAENWIGDMRLEADFISSLDFSGLSGDLDSAPKRQSLCKLLKVLRND